MNTTVNVPALQYPNAPTFQRKMAVIKVENLSKIYRLGEISTGTFFRDFERWFARMRGKPDPYTRIGEADHGNRESDEIWALRDVSFEVEQGEVLGIIGRNGAGKSTLLKILSRVTAPTSGQIKVKGRVASLLEVGTGFHPELTGRENIYLNGAILGMTKAEVRRKFDEIVDFAGVEQYIDTPVKRYSSGMHVRLAFAVAAHLDPEILVVDEVLAVGDAEFQKKCLGKMGEVARGGRTVLFVSHQMNAIQELCQRAMLLQKGYMSLESGDVRFVIKEYLFGQQSKDRVAEWVNLGGEFSNPLFKPLRFALCDGQGCVVPMPVSNDTEIWLHIDAVIEEVDSSLTVGYSVISEEGHMLYWSYQTDAAEQYWPKLHKGKVTLRTRLPSRFFNEGVYRIELIGGLHFRKWLFVPGIDTPHINLEIRGGLSESPLWITKRPGLLAPVMLWEAI